MKKFKELFNKDVVNTPTKRFVFLVAYGILFVAFGVFMSQVFLQPTPVVMSDAQYKEFTELFMDTPNIEITGEDNSDVVVDGDDSAGVVQEG